MTPRAHHLALLLLCLHGAWSADESVPAPPAAALTPAAAPDSAELPRAPRSTTLERILELLTSSRGGGDPVPLLVVPLPLSAHGERRRDHVGRGEGSSGPRRGGLVLVDEDGRPVPAGRRPQLVPLLEPERRRDPGRENGPRRVLVPVDEDRPLSGGRRPQLVPVLERRRRPPARDPSRDLGPAPRPGLHPILVPEEPYRGSRPPPRGDDLPILTPTQNPFELPVDRARPRPYENEPRPQPPRRGGFVVVPEDDGPRPFGRPPARRPPAPARPDDDDPRLPPRAPAAGEDPRLPPRAPSAGRPDNDDPRLPPRARYLPQMEGSSQRLLEYYRAQAPTAPHLPPAVFELPAGWPGAGRGPAGDGAGTRRYLPPANEGAAPPVPRFRRSLQLRAMLSVPHSDYSEPYTAWWDAASGAARVDFHAAGTSTVRTPMPDGMLRRVEVRTDRSDGRDVVRCGVARPSRPTADDRVPVGLPDMSQFEFAGYSREAGNGSRAEVWRRVVRGGPGAMGAAGGEELTFRHEMMLHRRGDQPLPLQYSVNIDSNVLGERCDGYHHEYMEVLEAQPDPEYFQIDLERACDERETLETVEGADSAAMARLEPLREFTRPARSALFDDSFDRFKQQFTRRYADAAEEAMRKALIVQNMRFVEACNRMGAPFEAAVNYLSDRLEVEIELLLGVSYSPADEEARDKTPFPYGEGEVRRRGAALPDEFDWRPLGAVSPVRAQESCKSCWAFAVAGSVEGALAARRGSLVPLSVQELVDCGHKYRTNGCPKGTWPVHAFNYVRTLGLTAWEEYPTYVARNETCRAPPVPPVTRITAGRSVPPENLDALKVAIREFSPAVVVIDASCKTFRAYNKGVLQDERCVKGPKKKLNHAVLAVGWDTWGGGSTAVILKNSWGAAWGDAGYIRVDGSTNTGGVLTTPDYTVLRDEDVLDGRRGPPRGGDRDGGPPRGGDRDGGPPRGGDRDGERGPPRGASRPRPLGRDRDRDYDDGFQGYF